MIEEYVRRRVETILAFELQRNEQRRRAVHKLLKEAVRYASERIILHADTHAGFEGMGTTLVLALFCGGRAFLAHVGDSRAYLLREGAVDLLTEDHSLFFELVRTGRLPIAAQANFPFKNIVTRALGMRGAPPADVLDIEVLNGDIVLLCTDGLHSYVDEGLISRFLKMQELEQAADGMIKFANEAGGADNITVVVAKVLDSGGDTDRVLQDFSNITRFPILEGLERGEILRLISAAEMRTYLDGETLFAEGQFADGLYGVLRGQVEIFRGGEKVASFGAGTHFGEMSLVEELPRNVKGTAKGLVDVLVLPRAGFWEILRASPYLGARLLVNLVRILGYRLRVRQDELNAIRTHFAVFEPEAGEDGSDGIAKNS
jgi:serine/threonine protein phosphatase PrpC